ncbi:MAG: hypothetical protein HYV28_02530 [Ignavibacteriales bacterium]|nr:hypothetical protein [Ignavibacteriales bacterium]
MIKRIFVLPSNKPRPLHNKLSDQMSDTASKPVKKNARFLYIRKGEGELVKRNGPHKINCGTNNKKKVTTTGRWL